MNRYTSGDANYAGCGHLRSAIVASFCEHPGCYNARKQPTQSDSLGLDDGLFPMPPAPGRTPGQAKIATLNAAADWLRERSASPHVSAADRAMFRAWAEQVEEVTDPRNQVRAWFILAACAATGVLAGAVAVMVLSR